MLGGENAQTYMVNTGSEFGEFSVKEERCRWAMPP